MFKVLIFEFEECSTSCLIGVLIAFALFVAILSSTMFSSEQVFDYDKHTPVVANTTPKKSISTPVKEEIATPKINKPPRKTPSKKPKVVEEEEEEVTPTPKKSTKKAPKSTPGRSKSPAPRKVGRSKSPAVARDLSPTPEKKRRASTKAKV